MFCTKCGEQIPDNSKFCTKCGARLDGAFEDAPTKKLPSLNMAGSAQQPVSGYTTSEQLNPTPPKRKRGGVIIGIVLGALALLVAIAG